MFYIWKQIIHFFVSNSRHGTHSPFVYALADQVIYVPSATCRQRTILPEGFSAGYRDLLADILSHWSIPNLTEYPELVNTSAVWVTQEPFTVGELVELVGEGKIVIVHEPYRTKHSLKKWQALCHDPTIVISIDLFHFGVVLQRTGQRKEHFFLRYPYWRH